MEKDRMREAWNGYQPDWPDSYYAPIDGAKRKELLDNAIKKDASKENKIRIKLWEYRYGKEEENHGKPAADYYIRFLMNLRFASLKINSMFHSNGMVKELRQDLEKMGVESIQKLGEVGENLLYQEFYQLGRFYLDLCLKDRNYTSVCLGIISLKEDKLYDKLAEDVYRIAYEAPKELGLEKELKLFTKGITKAFETDFPAQSIRLLTRIEEK